LSKLPPMRDPNLLVGVETSDDAAVYKLTDDIALILTLDFFTPIVDDPYMFGQIAAANSLSDVYAMGGRPIAALNIVCFPPKKLHLSILEEILRGGVEKVLEAGAVLVGGHSVDDMEPKYGLSVAGIVHPQQVKTNSNARPGDKLVLTKPLGTGIIATAVKAEMASPEAEKAAMSWMVTLNRAAAEAMVEVGAHACTDITGFGLMGHALELARGSRVDLLIRAGNLPLLPEVLEYASMGLVPGGAYNNRRFCGEAVEIDSGVPQELQDVLFDPQTSGGLLISVAPEKVEDLLCLLEEKGVRVARVVGEVLPGEGRIRVVP